jgi:hypothetical protein
LYQGSIGARWHGLDDDCIKTIDIINKHVLHTFEGTRGKAPVMLVYMVPVMALVSATKQNTSCMAQISLGGDMQSTLACTAIMLDCMLRVDAVLARCRRMWPLSVAVENGRWFLINVVVRPGIVASSSLRPSAWRSVDAGGEHMI